MAPMQDDTEIIWFLQKRISNEALDVCIAAPVHVSEANETLVTSQ